MLANSGDNLLGLVVTETGSEVICWRLCRCNSNCRMCSVLRATGDDPVIRG